MHCVPPVLLHLVSWMGSKEGSSGRIAAILTHGLPVLSAVIPERSCGMKKLNKNYEKRQVTDDVVLCAD